MVFPNGISVSGLSSSSLLRIFSPSPQRLLFSFLLSSLKTWILLLSKYIKSVSCLFIYSEQIELSLLNQD